MKKNETVSINWIDNGFVHGAFAINIMGVMMKSSLTQNPVVNINRTYGGVVHYNREILLKGWEEDKTDWFLSVDSDVVLDIDIYKMLCEKADKDNAPVVCGIYFIEDNTKSSNLTFSKFDNIHGSIYAYNDEEVKIMTNELIRIKSAGLGLTMIHKDVFKKLREHYKDASIYGPYLEGEGFIGEDISFFRKLEKLNIPVHVHTSAIAVHLKTVGIGYNISEQSKRVYESMKLGGSIND